MARATDGPALDVLRARGVLHAVRDLPLRADDRDLHPVVPGPHGGLTFPLNGVSLLWFERCSSQQAHRRHRRRVLRSLALALIVVMV